MITEQEFELQKQIWELEKANLGLTIGLVVLGAILTILLASVLYIAWKDYEQ